MNADTPQRRDYGFVLGLLTGTFVSAGLMLWFAPRMASEIREGVADSAKTLRTLAVDQYEQVAVRAGEAVDDLTQKGQGVRDPS